MSDQNDNIINVPFKKTKYGRRLIFLSWLKTVYSLNLKLFPTNNLPVTAKNFLYTTLG